MIKVKLDKKIKERKVEGEKKVNWRPTIALLSTCVGPL
jgi:hypothetical protein